MEGGKNGRGRGRGICAFRCLNCDLWDSRIFRIRQINAEQTKLTRFALFFLKKEGFDLPIDRNPNSNTLVLTVFNSIQADYSFKNPHRFHH